MTVDENLAVSMPALEPNPWVTPDGRQGELGGRSPADRSRGKAPLRKPQ